MSRFSVGIGGRKDDVIPGRARLKIVRERESNGEEWRAGAEQRKEGAHLRGGLKFVS
jgi:hypothetical protein